MLLRPPVIVAVGLVATVAAVVLGLSLDGDEPDTPPPPAASGALPNPLPAENARLPAVDVLRVGAGGDAMIAGRALAGTAVKLVDGLSGAELGHTIADPRGDWVLVPDLPLAPGARLLMPRMVAVAEGGGAAAAEVAGDAVAVVVPPAGQEGGLAVVLPERGGSRVLPAAAADEPGFAITTADRDSQGRLTLGGRAEPQATIHLYLDNRFIGRSRVGADGSWRLTARAPRHGQHAVRADQIDAHGKVIRREECGWPAGDDGLPAGELAVAAESGLWRVAWRAKGGGGLYTVVYGPAALRAGDPDMIYPGQVVSANRP